jgi:predicted ATPase
MLNSLEINNFRCFKHLKQGSLKRFNFIVGEGGSGKTALLEAVFLAAGGNPEIYLRLRNWRGFGEIRLAGTRESFESLFSDLFFEFDQKSGVIIRLSDSVVGDRILRIYYSIDDPMSFPLKGRIAETGTFFIHPIHFKWKAGDKTVDSKIYVEENTLKISGSQDVYPVYMVSPQTANIAFYAERFSELSKKKAQRPVIDAVRQLFPEVEDLTLETIAGHITLHASLAGMDNKIPVAVLSGGMNKYLSVVLAILANPGGVVLIDEIENGFYYKFLSPMLRTIITLCEEHKVQLIASTHSYEFLQALAPIIEERNMEENVALLRMTRKNNESTIKYIKGESYEAAIGQGFEVR